MVYGVKCSCDRVLPILQILRGWGWGGRRGAGGACHSRASTDRQMKSPSVANDDDRFIGSGEDKTTRKIICINPSNRTTKIKNYIRRSFATRNHAPAYI